MVFELLRAHYRNCGGFFSFLRPSGDGWLSKTAGVLFSLYSLVLLYMAFHFLFCVRFLSEKTFLPVYLVLMYAAVFFTSASFARGLFETDAGMEMLKSFPIGDKTFFASRLLEMMADSFFPAAAAFLPLVFETGVSLRLPFFLLLFLSTWAGSSLLTAFLAIRATKRMFMVFVVADAVLLSAFFLFSVLENGGGQTVSKVAGIIPATAACSSVFLLMLPFSFKAFFGKADGGRRKECGAYVPGGCGMLETLFLRQMVSLASDGALVVKVVAASAAPLVILLALFFVMGSMDSLAAVCALSLISSHAPLPAASYSRDSSCSGLLAPLPVPRRTDIFSRMLFHSVFSSLSVAAYALVTAALCWQGFLHAAASFLYPVVHSLVSGAIALVTDLRRVEKSAFGGGFREYDSGFCTLKPFLLSVLLEIVSISVSVILGLEGPSFLMFCVLFETATGIVVLYKAGKDRR